MLAEILLATALVVVTDGDTIRTNQVPYRLVGFNTPELSSGKCIAERYLASAARRRLQVLVRDPTAKLQEVLCFGSNFGRKCAVITIKGKNVGDVLISERLAEPYSCGPSGCPKRKDWCK